MMTLDLWESFPVELQQLLTEEAWKVALDIMNKFIELESLAGEAIISGDVVTIVEARELQEAADKSRAAYVASLPDSAPASVSDPEAVIQNYLNILDTWTQFMISDGYEIPAGDLDSILDAFRALPQTDFTPFHQQFREEYVLPNLPK